MARITESDMNRLVRRIIKESESDNVKKTDAKNNPYWKMLQPKLKSLGFSSKLERIKSNGDLDGYPDVDFYQETMTHKSGIVVRYPFSLVDYTGDYYSDFIDLVGIKNIKNINCLGTVPDEPSIKKIKVKCVDYIYKLIKDKCGKEGCPTYIDCMPKMNGGLDKRCNNPEFKKRCPSTKFTY